MPLDSPNIYQLHSNRLPLTPREHQVLKELALGSSNKLIAKNLSISTYTVDGYVKEIYRKLGVRNRSMAAVMALHHGILDISSPAMASSQKNSA